MLKLRYKFTDNLNSLILILLLSIFYLLQDVYRWPIIRTLNAQGPFVYVDTFTVLHYSECYEIIDDLVFSSNTLCSKWTYSSSILRFLSFMGFGVSHTQIIGHIFTYLCLLTLVVHLVYFQSSKIILATIFLGFMSPSVWLLLERANFDIFIYLLVFVSAFLYSKNYYLASVFFLFLGSIFKFYTLPLLLILGVLSKKFVFRFTSVIAFAAGLFLVLSDLMKMEGKILQAGNNHFGMKIIGNYLGKVGLNLDFYWAYLLGFVMFVMCALFLLLLDARFKFIKWDQMIIPSLLQHIVIFMSGVHLICFFVGLSVDYRLIFYITSAPYMILFLKSNVRSKFIIVFLISVWLVYPVGVLQTIGDFALEIVTAFQLIFILKVFTYNFTQLCKR